MVIIRVKVITQQPSINILLWTGAHDTVRKRIFIPLQETKRKIMIILKEKKAKLSNEDANTRRNPDSTSGIYLIAVKLAQCRQVAANRRKTVESKKIITKKTATGKVHLQLTIFEAFDRLIISIRSLSLSTTDEERFIQLVLVSRKRRSSMVHCPFI